jgi:cytochrome c-type biogenesis protein CcmH
MRLTGALAAITVLALTTAAGAATPRASFNDIEDEVMCVSCNVALNIAESPQADRERAEIKRLIASGLTKQQIKDRLKAQYGPNVLALPDSGGFNFAAYAVPIAAVAIVLALLAVLVPRWRRPPGAPPPDSPELDPGDERRLDEDLARSGV